MSNIELISFPFDSMKVLNEESGKMEGDRKYDARIFQNYFKKFLSNGVYYGHYKNYGENGMKVILDGGLTIKIKKGAGIVEGADFELEQDALITLERPATGERIDRIVIKKDSSLSARNTVMYVKQGTGTTPATLERNENIYEICIAEIKVKSTTNITETDITDTRLDKTLCGIVNSLISVDGEEIYTQFQEYIDSVTDNLVRKDQDNVITGKVIVQGGIEGNVKGDLEGNAKTATNAQNATNADYANSADTASSCSGNAATASVAKSAEACTR